ncbi:MAG: ORF6N domain-containing protein [Paludibacteraceae bacterium]|nr:ORF6N domain-containing protein [Paludibacteraceae bacterium]
MSKKNDIQQPLAVQAIDPQQIQQMIHFIRGERVILDRDLAILYGVETKNLKRQVKRNIARFPADFMIELTREEYNSLRCQNGTIENGRGEHSKYLPYAFTENGVAMLSSVLTSEVAVQINIQIMRAFTLTRKALTAISQTELRQEKLERKVEQLACYMEDILRDQSDINKEVQAQMDAICESLEKLADKVVDLAEIKNEPRNPIGYEAIDEQREAKKYPKCKSAESAKQKMKQK